MDELPDAGCMLCNTARHTGTIWFDLTAAMDSRRSLYSIH